jgi:hypothetical protein
MPCHLRGDLNRDEGFSDVVGPEDVKDLQTAHHKHHEHVREVKHSILKLV